MKASDIIIQLQSILPAITNLFSEQIPILSIVPAGITATATTTAAHGLSVGEAVNISGTLAPVVISSITRAAGVATAITLTAHDITEGDLTKTVTLSGSSESEFNGTFPFLSANNRKEFQFTVPDAGPVTGSGSPILEDPPSAFGFNGLKIVTSILSATIFEYTLPLALTVPAVGAGVVHNKVRVTGAVSIDRALDMYTKQITGDALWAFVVLGDTVASKDRNSRNDSITSASPGSDRRQQIFQTFSVFVVKPSTSELSAREARDTMEDVMPLLFKALLFFKGQTGLSAESGLGITFVSHGFEQYNTAVYVHEFQFQLLADITQNDTVDPDFNVAFRDISLAMTTSFGLEQMTASIDLDDDPLP